jgi:hypothetical protein
MPKQCLRAFYLSGFNFYKYLILRYAPRWNRTNKPVIKSRFIENGSLTSGPWYSPGWGPSPALCFKCRDQMIHRCRQQIAHQLLSLILVRIGENVGRIEMTSGLLLLFGHKRCNPGIYSDLLRSPKPEGSTSAAFGAVTGALGD